MSRFSLLFLVLFFLANNVLAQPISSASRMSPEVYLSVDKAAPGQEITAVLFMNLQDGWHVNAHIPTLDYLIGTALTLEPHDFFIITDLVYPEAKAYDFAFAGGEKLLVYEGKSPIFVGIRASSRITPGDYILTGTLLAQACDDHTCLAPSRIPVQFPVEVVSDPSTVSQINQDQFTAYVPGGGYGQSRFVNNDIAALFDSRSGLAAFFVIFLIGLALNLTPCVYPMLSVTVSIFGAQTDKRSGVVFSKAVIYVLGIATMYSALGVMAALSGGLFGSWLQSSALLAFIGLLFLILALSMFGFYELQIPYWLSSKIATGNTGSFIGIYISGLVVGIFAAPCIGPPIIALMAFVGTNGDPFFGFWAFFILSLGLGFPYLILGTFTGLIHKLPRSGTWMVWVKKVFGIVLIGLGFFYIGLAFYPAYVLHIIIITLLVGGVYLGFVDKTGSDRPVFQKVKWAVGLVSIFVGIMLILNLQKEGIEWDAFSNDKLQSALETNTPVILDFYADWCIPCLELERTTFTDPRVIDATIKMVRLKVDLTHFDSPESESLREQFNIAGVPTIIFLNSDGEEVENARIVGYLNADQFLRRVEMID